MKIELKKISVNERMSEETTMFIADLYIDGKKAGYCRNDGRGGCTEYHGYSKEDNELIAKAEAYCKTLPKVKFNDMEWEQSLEGVIDELLTEHLKAKEEKKMQKLYATAIVFGVPNGSSYRYLNFKRPLTGLPINVLKAHVDMVLEKHCNNGVIILNDNIVIDGDKIIIK